MHCYPQELGDICLLVCIILCPILLMGNYVKLCFVIFSFVCIYELELAQIKVPEKMNLKKKGILFFFNMS